MIPLMVCTLTNGTLFSLASRSKIQTQSRRSISRCQKINHCPTLDPALCGLAEGAKILGDRWVLLILREAFYGVTRFETMLSHTHITRQTLTTRLKTMTETGLLSKVPYREAGSPRTRYEYVLTDKSRSLALVLFALMEWGHQHVLHSAPHIALVDSASGEAVHPGFITASGTVASPAALQIVKVDER